MNQLFDELIILSGGDSIENREKGEVKTSNLNSWSLKLEHFILYHGRREEKGNCEHEESHSKAQVTSRSERIQKLLIAAAAALFRFGHIRPNFRGFAEIAAK